MKTPELERLLEKSRKYCSTRETCRFDMSNKLRQWGAGDEMTEKILTKLEQENFIDESRYAKAVVSDKFRFEKWGRNKIRHFLCQHRIGESLIEQALQSLIEDDYMEMIRQELQKKNASIKTNNFWDRKAKLFRFAQSRGFESDLSMQVIDEIFDV